MAKLSSIEEAKAGDKLNIKTSKEEVECILMSRPEYLDKEHIVVKLNSGYNKAILISEIKTIESLEIANIKETSSKKQIKQAKNLPKISILHTGGTIASKVDYKTGGVVAKFTPEDLLAMFPEIESIAQIESKLISNMWSDDMRFDHYNIMAESIKEEIKNGSTGIIITQGTDTLHYTSAALTFILNECQVPVLVVGAQRSSDRASSDAAYNIISAVQFLTSSDSDFGGVGVCMHATQDDEKCMIMPGLKVRKMHTSRRDAFQSINIKPIAYITYATKKITFTDTPYKKREETTKKEIKLKLINPKLKIGIIKIHPHMYKTEFECYKSFDGLIIEGTGLGHAPISEMDEFTKEHNKIKEVIRTLNGNKVLIAMAPQTIYGRINMNVYAPGRELQELGVIGNLSDMTPETAFIKMAWLLSNYSYDEAKKLFSQNLKGEITKRTDNSFTTKN